MIIEDLVGLLLLNFQAIWNVVDRAGLGFLSSGDLGPRGVRISEVSGILLGGVVELCHRLR